MNSRGPAVGQTVDVCSGGFQSQTGRILDVRGQHAFLELSSGLFWLPRSALAGGEEDTPTTPRSPLSSGRRRSSSAPGEWVGHRVELLSGKCQGQTGTVTGSGHGYLQVRLDDHQCVLARARDLSIAPEEIHEAARVLVMLKHQAPVTMATAISI